MKLAIYTSNPIKRMNKEFRKRLQPMNSLTNMEAVEKILYLTASEYDEYDDYDEYNEYDEYDEYVRQVRRVRRKKVIRGWRNGREAKK